MNYKIGPYEASVIIRRIRVLAEPQRQALIAECAAKCPPGKNKRHLRQQAERWTGERRAA